MRVFARSPIILAATTLALIASAATTAAARAETVVTVNVPVVLHEMPAEISEIVVRCGIRLQDPVTGNWEEVYWTTRDVAMPANGELATTVVFAIDRNSFYPTPEARLTGPMSAVCELGLRIGGNNYTVDNAYNAAPGPRAKKPGTTLASHVDVDVP